MFKFKKKKTLEDSLAEHYNNLASLLMMIVPEEGFEEIHLRGVQDKYDTTLVGYVLKTPKALYNSFDRAYSETGNVLDVLTELNNEIRNINSTMLEYNQNKFDEVIFALYSDGAFNIDYNYDIDDFNDMKIYQWSKQVEEKLKNSKGL